MTITCPHCTGRNKIVWEGQNEWVEECQSCGKDFAVNAIQKVNFTSCICLCQNCQKPIDKAFWCDKCKEQRRAKAKGTT